MKFGAILGVLNCLLSLQTSATAMKMPTSNRAYQVANVFPVGGDGGWDYISVDSGAKRIYASHGNQVEVLDEGSGKSVGVITDTPGVHGIAIASDLKRGFTSNGGDGSVTIFDTESLKTIRKV